jgi:hypothetical protein
MICDTRPSSKGFGSVRILEVGARVQMAPLNYQAKDPSYRIAQEHGVSAETPSMSLGLALSVAHTACWTWPMGGSADAELLVRLGGQATCYGRVGPQSVASHHRQGKIGGGLASVEVGMDAAGAATLSRAAMNAERKLQRRGEVKVVKDFASGPVPAVYFDSRGPSCRAVIADMFWVAAIDDDVAVLLVGSAANAVASGQTTVRTRRPSPSADPVGAARFMRQHQQRAVPVVAPDDVFSPSADPVGAARSVLQGPEGLAATANHPTRRDIRQATDADVSDVNSEMRIGTLAYAWKALMLGASPVITVRTSHPMSGPV